MKSRVVLAIAAALVLLAATSVPPLVAASTSGDIVAARTLLASGANPNARDQYGISALEWASARGHLDVAEALLRAHAAVDGAYNALRVTPLMRAAFYGHADIVNLLLAHGARIDARATNGYTALTWAVLGGNAAAISLLERRGAHQGEAIGPQALCNAGGSSGFDASPAWSIVAGDPPSFFCQAMKHDFPGGDGNVLMYAYEIDGTANHATLAYIKIQIYDSVIPAAAIATTLKPLLTQLYAAGGKGPIAGDLVDTLAACTPVTQASPLGTVTAAYTAGSDANEPTNGATYVIRIVLN